MHAIRSQSTAESADFAFTVKEGASGKPSIMLEPRGTRLPALGDGFLSLELREGITLRHAEEIARQLNDNVARVSHTKFGETR